MSPLAQPYRWPDGVRCAAVFSADVDGESPFVWRNRGQDVQRLGEMEQRRFGPRVGVWRILDLLDEFKIKGSFYVPAMIATVYPEILPAISARGHETGAHGYFHERVDEIDDAHNAIILERTLEVFHRQLGQKPKGYRSPSWELTPGVHKLLLQHGFAYDSSLMGFDHPYSLGGLTEVPVQWLIDDAVYFRFTGGAADRTPVDPAAVLNGWIEEFEAMVEFGGVFMITIHPWISGRGQRVRMLRTLLARILATKGVWITTAAEIAAFHQRSTNQAAFDVPVKLVDTNIRLA